MTKKPKKKTVAAKPKAKSAGARARYNWTEAEASAAKGTVPPPPDFSAATHKPWQPIIDEVIKASKDKDEGALRKIQINPTSSTPKAIDRYRSICLAAIKAKAA